MAFAGVGDQLTALPATDLTLEVTGPFSSGVPVDESNTVLRAARVLQAVPLEALPAHEARSYR